MSEKIEPVLEAHGLGKAYSLSVAGSQKRRGGDIWRAILQRKPAERTAEDKDLFWAIKDISITLQPGESLGVIGRNGAGKTTLMKMLSGILPPDEGSVIVRGDIQAMVNLSGGIDKNLSGRQNIANAAALRGLTSKQLSERVDQIIAFAELENAIDRLVSTYSSGMKARLGFAICVHMDPSLLVIDEALAVGDTRFKQKCLRRLNEMRANGVAMILVSHSFGQIRQFCNRAIWLDEGTARADSTPMEVIQAYQKYLEDTSDEEEDPKAKAKQKARSKYDKGKLPVRLEDLETSDPFIRNIGPFGAIILDPRNLESVSLEPADRDKIQSLQDVEFDLKLKLKRQTQKFNFGIRIYTDQGEIALAQSSMSSFDPTSLEAGDHQFKIRMKQIPLSPGEYHCVLSINDGSEKLFRSVASVITIKTSSTPSWNAPAIAQTITERVT